MGYVDERNKGLARVVKKELQNISKVGKAIYKKIPKYLDIDLDALKRDLHNGNMTTGSGIGDYCLHTRLNLSLPEIIPHQDFQKSYSSRNPIEATYIAANILEYLNDKAKLVKLSKELSELEFYLIPFAGVEPQGDSIFSRREDFSSDGISYDGPFTLDSDLIIGRAEGLGLNRNLFSLAKKELGDLEIHNIEHISIENRNGGYLIRKSNKRDANDRVALDSDLNLSGIYWQLINIKNRMLMGKQNISEALKYNSMVNHIFDLFFSEQYNGTDSQGKYDGLYEIGKDGIFKNLTLGKPLFKVEYDGIKPIEEQPAQLTAA